MHLYMSALLIVFPALMAYAAVSDLLTMTISNRISLLLTAGFIVLALAGGLSWHAIGMHGLAALCTLVVTFGMFAAGWMGGGDAKIAAATMLWLGFGGVMEYALMTAMAGGVLTFVVISFRDYPLPAFAENWEWSRRLHSATSGIPYGIALAFGALIAYPHTDLWRLAIFG